MKKLKKKGLFIGTGLIICLVLCVVLVALMRVEDNKEPVLTDFNNKRIEELQTEEKTKDEINTITSSLFDKDIEKEELEELVGSSINDYMIYYGKDSYIRNLGKDIEDVDFYNKKRDEYASNLEQYVRNNFELDIKEYIVSADGAIVQKISYRTYYYDDFINDYFALCNELAGYTDLNIDVISQRGPTKEENAKLYKISVKALELMNDHFVDYVNDGEFTDYDLIYKKGYNVITNDYFSLLVNLYGLTYSDDMFSEEERETRIDKIINSAIEAGKLDINNPYQLN